MFLAGAGFMAWNLVPLWCPEWVLEHSPWLEPAVRSLATQRTKPLRVFDPGREEPDAWTRLLPNCDERDDGHRPYQKILHGGPTALIPLIRSGRPAVRREAAALGLAHLHRDPNEDGDDIARVGAFLQACLESPDPVVRSLGIHWIGCIETDWASAYLDRVREDLDPRTRAHVQAIREHQLVSEVEGTF